MLQLLRFLLCFVLITSFLGEDMIRLTQYGKDSAECFLTLEDSGADTKDEKKTGEEDFAKNLKLHHLFMSPDQHNLHSAQVSSSEILIKNDGTLPSANRTILTPPPKRA